MIGYLIRRLLSGLVILFIYVSILFFIIQIILPGDYVSQNTLGLTLNEAKEIRQQLGLDLPLFQSYIAWFASLLKGDLGISYSVFGGGGLVSDVIKNTLPITLLIFGLGTSIAFVFGQWLGKMTAWRGGGCLSGGLTFLAIAVYTSFPPWLAFVVLYLSSKIFDIPFLLAGRISSRQLSSEIAAIMWQMILGLLVSIVVLALTSWILNRIRHRSLPALLWIIIIMTFWGFSWLLLGIQDQAMDILRSIAMPTMVYSLLSFGELMLIMRTTVIETMHEDYIQTGRAKGLPDHVVRDRYAVRNALLPVVSRLVISFPFLFSGMVMIERVFNVEGIGTTLFYAVGMQNIPLALGALIIIGVIALVAHLVLDVIQIILDPRLRVINH